MNECAISFNVLGVWMPIVLILGSCQQKLKTLYPLMKYATLENFQTAYTAELRHYRWYTRFVQQAKEDRLVNVAALFKRRALNLNKSTLKTTHDSYMQWAQNLRNHQRTQFPSM